MENTVLALAFSFMCSISNAQSEMIKKVFRLLPANKIYGLTIATRDSMLQGKTYYPAGNDSTEIQAYNYGLSQEVKDYMYVSMSFETGQRGSGMIEIRSFPMANGDHLILVSKTGGVGGIIYEQHDLAFFIYGKDRKLMTYKKKLLPAANETMFMKPGIPASIKKNIMDNANRAFDLSHEKVMLTLNSDYISDNKEAVKWLKGDRVYFDWAKDQFVIGKPGFE